MNYEKLSFAVLYGPTTTEIDFTPTDTVTIY